MKLKLPEYLLCEDPTSEQENLFIYHVGSKSLVHIIHTDAEPVDVAEIQHINGGYFNYTYTDNLGKTQQIMFVMANADGACGQAILKQCAYWYAHYLGWETQQQKDVD